MSIAGHQNASVITGKGMGSLMQRIGHYFEKAQEYLIASILLIMSVVVFWQVITRFVLNNPSSWSEELARYGMVWLGFLGGAIGVKRSSHMCINLLVDRIGNRRMRALAVILGHLFGILMGVILLVYGYEFMVEGHNQMSTALGINMSYVYFVIPFSGFIIIVNSLEHAYYAFIENYTKIKSTRIVEEKFTVHE